MSVDDVIKSGLLNVIGLFSRDVIGWKTRVEFVNSHWSVSIRLLFVGLFVGLFTSLMSLYWLIYVLMYFTCILRRTR